jgi:plastocyanin
VQGYPDGTFKPTQQVNLVENLKMLLNARKVDLSKISVPENPYVDASRTEWYAKFVQYGKMSNLLTPDAAGKIYPSQGMTRGKLAEVSYRLIYMQENQLDMYPPQNPTTPTTTNTTSPTVSPVITDTTIIEPVVHDPNLTPDTQDQLVMKVNIQSGAFKMDTMTVGVGTKVVWINGDTMGHSVVSDSGTTLKSGTLLNGQTYAHVFNSTGTFTYHCGIHPTMKGTIIVKPAIEVPTI